MITTKTRRFERHEISNSLTKRGVKKAKEERGKAKRKMVKKMVDKPIKTKLKIVEINNINDAQIKMQEIGVDKEGLKWMVNKAIFKVIKVENINNKAANILKQEMLSLGGEVAISYKILEFKEGYSDVLIMGTLKQYSLLVDKLQIQPFGLAQLSLQIKDILWNFGRINNFKLKCGNYVIDFKKKTYVMGILNFTPDSFFDGGKYHNIDTAIKYAEKMVLEGADIIDVGGESSRPGAEIVSLKEELERVIPIIKELSKRIRIPISIDTYKSKVAEQALDNGATIVNDISALRLDLKMAKVIIKYDVPVVLMHMQGLPKNMQDNPKYKDVISEIIAFLKERVNFAQKEGVKPENIIIDPGIGFGKTTEHNLEIIKHLKEFKILDKPILLGPSCKRFIGDILNLPVDQRDEGTLSVCVISMLNGANILRVHNVCKTVRALRMAEAVS